MKRSAVVLFLLMLCGGLFGQNTDNQYFIFNNVIASDLKVDVNGTLYAIHGSVLTKLRPDNELMLTYDALQYGDITSIDVDNPLKIMLFYRDAAKIVFLDDKLTPIIEPLDLLAHNWQSITLATYVTDNHLWLYDNSTQELIEVDFHLNELSRTRLLLDDFSPTQIFSLRERELVMNNPSTGVVFFDAFGTYLKTISLPTEGEVQVDNSFIHYIEDRHLLSYNYRNLSQNFVKELPFVTKKFALSRQYLYFLTEDNEIEYIKFR